MRRQEAGLASCSFLLPDLRQRRNFFHFSSRVSPESWTNLAECGIFGGIREATEAMIAQAQVIIVLKPWLGAPLLEALMPLMGDVAARLSGFSIRGGDNMAQELDSLLFRAARSATGGKLLAQLDDGSFVRIRLEDFAAMADELMLLAFNELPVDSRHLLFLRDYSMRHASLSALRALYTRFSSLQSPQELEAIASVAKACYPAFRWREWLP